MIVADLITELSYEDCWQPVVFQCAGVTYQISDKTAIVKINGDDAVAITGVPLFGDEDV